MLSGSRVVELGLLSRELADGYNYCRSPLQLLRTFARKSSNINFFLNFHQFEIMGYLCKKCKKIGGVTEFVSEI